MKTNLETKLKVNEETWEKVRKWFNYPVLREPEIVGYIEGGAHFDFLTRKTRIGASFLKETIEKTEISEEQFLEGVLTHETGHYMVFPKNLATIILSGKMLNDFFGNKKDGLEKDKLEKYRNEELQNFIFQTYGDIVNDYSSALDQNKREAILSLREATQKIDKDKLDRNIREVMLAYLNKQIGRDYELKPELKSYLEEMLEIEFLDVNGENPKKPAKLGLNLYKWGEIVKEMIEKYEDKKGLNYFLSDLNIDSILKEATPGEIRGALREISDNVSRGVYKQVKEWLKNKGIDLPDSDREEIGIGTSKGELKIDREIIDYYRELSRQYPLVVEKKRIQTEETKRTFEGTKKWKVNDEPLLAMPHLSGGLILPGITRQVKISERHIKTTDYDLPHLLIAIDSSGSMPDPSDSKSYAVLGGFCASRSYHINNSSIGVINFSGDSFYLPYTRNLEDILGAVVAYQGGGTVVDVDILRKMLSPEEFKIYEEHPDLHIKRFPNQAIKKEIELSYETFKKALESGSIDLLMFTDGGIHNLDEVLDFFRDNKTLNRGTIVLTGNYEQSITENHPNVNVYRIDSEEDIPHIVLKDVRRNLNYHGSGE